MPELQKLTPFLMFQKGDAEAADGGNPLMPLDDYGFGSFGWTSDRFGVSWQLSLANEA
ncbi:VOC family protein [Allosaccharopolyspora coralli]|uniref:VOC family protein n=1 Tax=Allosaccharopolyspora coralli TaxID=2665642 RepID=UPI001E533281|nr:VOC family protein [Allosaccharopolyspora coralli]